MRIVNWFAASAALGVLAGCGGSGLPSAITGPEVNAIAQDLTLGTERVTLPDNQTYAALLATSGSGKIIIEGVGAYIPSQAPAGAPEYGEYVYGTRNLTTDHLLLTDTKFVLADTDGPTTPTASTFYYGTSAASEHIGVLARTAIDQSAYDFVRIGEARLGDGVTFDLVFGVSTMPGDVPGSTSGDVTYTGDALIVISSGSSATFNRGTSTATAHFGSGTVDVSAESGAISAFSEVEANGLTIDGNTFSGSDVILRDGGGADITASFAGTVSAEEAAGMFFGDNADEIGAYMLLEGSTNSVNVYIVGD